MELRHLKTFIAVSEDLSFRRAAERLHVTQPALSVQVRDLERAIGVRLLERDTHRVALTPAGRRFLEDGRQLLRDLEDSVRNTQRIGRGEAGQLSIGFVPSLGHGLMPGILKTFRQSYPDLDLRLSEADTSQQITALLEHRLDLGFIGLGLSGRTSDLELELVLEEKLVAAVPSGSSITRRSGRSSKTLPLKALAGENFVLSARQNAPIYNPWILALCQQAGFQPRALREIGQPITVLNYVAAGMGVSVLPAQFSRMSTVGVDFMPLHKSVAKYRYYAAWSPGNPHPAIANFVAVARREGMSLKG